MNTARKSISDSRMVKLTGMALALVLLFVASLAVGLPEFGLPALIEALSDVLAGRGLSEESRIIFLDLRLPRLCLAVVAGAGLSLAGVGTQAVLCNPLVSPSVLGLSAGAAFGASFAVLFSRFVPMVDEMLLLMLCAFGGAMLATGLCCLFSSFRRSSQETVILAGIAIGYVFSGAMIFLQYMAPDRDLRTMVFWSVGSLWNADWNALHVLAPSALAAALLLYTQSMKLNSLALGTEFAASVGVDVGPLRTRILVLSAALCAAVISFTGAIGFIGLLAPHITRAIFGTDHRWLIPASMVSGAMLLLAADVATRLIFWPQEIPVGAMTAMIGGPFFLWQLLRRRKDWWS